MSIIRKVSLKDALGNDTVYDIGAEGTNVRYNNANSVNDQIDSVSESLEGHVATTVDSASGIHGIRFLNNQLQLWDSTNEVWENKIQLGNLIYYVDGADGSDNNDGSQSYPFKTIGKALGLIGKDAARALTAQIFVADGEYAEDLTITGKNVSIAGINGSISNITIKGVLSASSFSKVYLNKINFNLSNFSNTTAVSAYDDALVVISGGISVIGNGTNIAFYATSGGNINIAGSILNNVSCGFKADGGVIRVSVNPSFTTVTTGAVVTNGGVIHFRSDISSLSGFTTAYDISAAYGGRIFVGNSDQMIGATASSAGKGGMVPAPATGDQNKVLKGNGTWGDMEGGHTVLNSDNSAMTQRKKLQIKDGIATDDSTNDKTIITVTKVISYEDYQALSTAEKNNGVVYFVPDAPSV